MVIFTMDKLWTQLTELGLALNSMIHLLIQEEQNEILIVT